MGKPQAHTKMIILILLLLFFSFMSTYPLYSMKRKQRARTLPPVKVPRKFQIQPRHVQSSPSLFPRSDSNENLLKAAKQSKKKQFKSLLRQPHTDINYQDKETGETVMHIAAKKGNLAFLKQIFQNQQKEYDLSIKDAKGRTALWYAVINEKNDPRVVQIFFQQKGISSVLASSFKSFCKAIEKKKVVIGHEIGSICKDFCGFLDADFITAVTKNKEVLGEFIVDMVDRGYYDLVILVMLKAQELNEELPIDNESLLYLATHNNFFKLVQLFLCNGTNPNFSGDNDQTPLHIAVKNNSFSIVKLLMEQGAQLFVLDKFNKTPLHIAVEKGYFNIVNYFATYHKRAVKQINTYKPSYKASYFSPLTIARRILKKAKETSHKAAKKKYESITKLLRQANRG